MTKYVGGKDFPEAVWRYIILDPEYVPTSGEQMGEVAGGEGK